MDRDTLVAYDKAAGAFAQDWHDQPPPSDLHKIVHRFFVRRLTADIGCGSGREVAWLNANGFPASGYDASDGLLKEARARYPQYTFLRDTLPQLAGVQANAFDNVLCETVIMHLPKDEIASSVRRLVDIAKPGGILYLSWRVTKDEDLRDKQGRLYAAFDAALVRAQFGSCESLLDEEVVSASSGKIIHRIVVRKSPSA